MSEERIEKLPADLKALEAALGGMRPAAGAIDRDRLMYLAGRASVDRGRRIARFGWPLASAALLLLSVTLLARQTIWPGGKERIVYLQSGDNEQVAIATSHGFPDLPSSWPPTTHSAEGDSDYLQLRNVVLTRGIEAVPSDQRARAPETPVPAWSALRDGRIGS
jgi:hypothetical protein